uniref:Adaptor related protein complex 2 subunit beta 1 n=1 Tax=Poecilia mexicana TaxID=48701 RepID=A0A3B3XVW0_9TELE
MTDSKYFTTTKKGEIFELKAELNSDKKEKKKEAVKKVIASMTVGKDFLCCHLELFIKHFTFSSCLLI